MAQMRAGALADSFASRGFRKINSIYINVVLTIALAILVSACANKNSADEVSSTGGVPTAGSIPSIPGRPETSVTSKEAEDRRQADLARADKQRAEDLARQEQARKDQRADANANSQRQFDLNNKELDIRKEEAANTKKLRDADRQSNVEVTRIQTQGRSTDVDRQARASEYQADKNADSAQFQALGQMAGSTIQGLAPVAAQVMANGANERIADKNAQTQLALVDAQGNSAVALEEARQRGQTQRDDATALRQAQQLAYGDKYPEIARLRGMASREIDKAKAEIDSAEVDLAAVELITSGGNASSTDRRVAARAAQIRSDPTQIDSVFDSATNKKKNADERKLASESVLDKIDSSGNLGATEQADLSKKLKEVANARANNAPLSPTPPGDIPKTEKQPKVQGGPNQSVPQPARIEYGAGVDPKELSEEQRQKIEAAAVNAGAGSTISVTKGLNGKLSLITEFPGGAEDVIDIPASVQQPGQSGSPSEVPTITMGQAPKAQAEDIAANFSDISSPNLSVSKGAKAQTVRDAATGREVMVAETTDGQIVQVEKQGNSYVPVKENGKYKAWTSRPAPSASSEASAAPAPSGAPVANQAPAAASGAASAAGAVADSTSNSKATANPVNVNTNTNVVSPSPAGASASPSGGAAGSSEPAFCGGGAHATEGPCADLDKAVGRVGNIKTTLGAAARENEKPEAERNTKFIQAQLEAAKENIANLRSYISEIKPSVLSQTQGGGATIAKLENAADLLDEAYKRVESGEKDLGDIDSLNVDSISDFISGNPRVDPKALVREVDQPSDMGQRNYTVARGYDRGFNIDDQIGNTVDGPTRNNRDW